jgi:hypothetical protein
VFALSGHVLVFYLKREQKMKKIMLAALCTVVFGVVGCSSQENPDKTAHRDYLESSANHRPKCKTKHCNKAGKLGPEKTVEDMGK